VEAPKGAFRQVLLSPPGPEDTAKRHYGGSKADARACLARVLRNGLLVPLNGGSVFAALEAAGGCGRLAPRVTPSHSRRCTLHESRVHWTRASHGVTQ